MQQSRKPCITVQPARVPAKHITSKSPLGKVIDVQDIGKLSDLVVTGLHMESEVGKAHKPCHLKPL